MPEPTREIVPDCAAGQRPDLAMLTTDTGFIAEQRRHPLVAASFQPIDVYDLERTDLSPYLGLVVPGLTDQEYLWRHGDQIRAYLEAGRVVVFSGMLCRPWLPGAGMFVPKAIRSHHDYLLRVVSPCPIFDGIEIEDLVFRRGVAGFFARGHHEPPPGAQVVLTLPDGEPALYLDRVSTPGTILVHGGNDLLGYASAERTAARLVPQLLAWMRAEARERLAALSAAPSGTARSSAEVLA